MLALAVAFSARLCAALHSFRSLCLFAAGSGGGERQDALRRTVTQEAGQGIAYQCIYCREEGILASDGRTNAPMRRWPAMRWRCDDRGAGNGTSRLAPTWIGSLNKRPVQWK